MSIIDKIQSVPIPILNLVFAVLISVMLLYPIGLPLTVDPMTRASYDAVQSLSEGSVVLVDYAVDPSAVIAVGGGAQSLVYQCLENNVNVILVSSSVNGPMFVESQVIPIADKLQKQHGVDFVHLGFFTGGEIGISAFLADFVSVFKNDHYGTPIENIELMQRITNHEQIDLLVYAGYGAEMPHVYLRQANTPYDIPLLVIGGSVTASGAMPYYPSQVVGVVTDLRGSAEYEMLIQRPGEALGTMDALSISYLWWILLILVSNLGVLKLLSSKKEET